MVVEHQGRLELITGPARSGKSAWAEQRAVESRLPVHDLATGPDLPDDETWQERVRQHRLRRPSSWHCLEVGVGLAACLASFEPDQTVLVDSLGSWICHSLDSDDSTWEQLCDALLKALIGCRSRVLLVSEQVGWGVVPATAVGGLFRDRLGGLEQRISAHCSHLWLVVAGRALDLLPGSHPVQPLLRSR